MIIHLPAVDIAQAAFGRRLRLVREARGFSLDRLAAETGLPLVHVELAERGRARLTSVELHAVINALHISLGLLQADGADLSRLRRL